MIHFRNDYRKKLYFDYATAQDYVINVGHPLQTRQANWFLVRQVSSYNNSTPHSTYGHNESGLGASDSSSK
jgi:hypothetical protein